MVQELDFVRQECFETLLLHAVFGWTAEQCCGNQQLPSHSSSAALVPCKNIYYMPECG